MRLARLCALCFSCFSRSLTLFSQLRAPHSLKTYFLSWYSHSLPFCSHALAWVLAPSRARSLALSRLFLSLLEPLTKKVDVTNAIIRNNSNENNNSSNKLHARSETARASVNKRKPSEDLYFFFSCSFLWCQSVDRSIDRVFACLLDRLS